MHRQVRADSGKRVHIVVPDGGEYNRSYKMWVHLPNQPGKLLLSSKQECKASDDTIMQVQSCPGGCRWHQHGPPQGKQQERLQRLQLLWQRA